MATHCKNHKNASIRRFFRLPPPCSRPIGGGWLPATPFSPRTTQKPPPRDGPVALEKAVSFSFLVSPSGQNDRAGYLGAGDPLSLPSRDRSSALTSHLRPRRAASAATPAALPITEPCSRRRCRPAAQTLASMSSRIEDPGQVRGDHASLALLDLPAHQVDHGQVAVEVEARNQIPDRDELR